MRLAKGILRNKKKSNGEVKFLRKWKLLTRKSVLGSCLERLLVGSILLLMRSSSVDLSRLRNAREDKYQKFLQLRYVNSLLRFDFNGQVEENIELEVIKYG